MADMHIQFSRVSLRRMQFHLLAYIRSTLSLLLASVCLVPSLSAHSAHCYHTVGEYSPYPLLELSDIAEAIQSTAQRTTIFLSEARAVQATLCFHTRFALACSPTTSIIARNLRTIQQRSTMSHDNKPQDTAATTMGSGDALTEANQRYAAAIAGGRFIMNELDGATGGVETRARTALMEEFSVNRQQHCQVHGYCTHTTDQCRSPFTQHHTDRGATDGQRARIAGFSTNAGTTVEGVCYQGGHEGHLARGKLVLLTAMLDAQQHGVQYDAPLVLLTAMLDAQQHGAQYDAGATRSLMSEFLATKLGTTIEARDGSTTSAVRPCPAETISSSDDEPPDIFL